MAGSDLPQPSMLDTGSSSAICKRTKTKADGREPGDNGVDSDPDSECGATSEVRSDPEDMLQKVEISVWPANEYRRPVQIRVDHDATVGQFHLHLKGRAEVGNHRLVLEQDPNVTYDMRSIYDKIMLDPALKNMVAKRKPIVMRLVENQ